MPETENPQKEKKIMQKTLACGKEKIIVFADHRERDCKVTDFLESMGCEVKKMQLEIADYVISNTVAIERKQAQDFLNSLLDGRLFSQLVFLAESYNQPLLLIEGRSHEIFSLSNVHKHAIIGALTSIALNYRIPVLFAETERETAEFIYVIAKRLQEGKDKEIALRKGRPGLTLEEQQRYVVESLPLVGPKTAKRLLEQFGSIKGVFNASEKDLEKVEKIGPKKAIRIRKLVEAKYSGGKKGS
ncbi:MAG: ERCC4 domain-containing protein [Candidatus Diapherotrites archaeon]